MPVIEDIVFWDTMNDWIGYGIPRADWLEAVALVVFMAIAVQLPERLFGWERVALAKIDRVLRRPWLAALCVGGVAGGLRLLIFPLIGYPAPSALDEYCYLLASDTFAHGRLTNPTHKLWVFFESFNVIQHPTYSSKYPPGQGLVMALGQVLTGHPWFGVWLSVAVACGVFYWTLAGWVPRRWALFGGVLAVLRWGIFGYWMNSYWGGALAAIGGCLVVGSVPRLRRKPGIAGALLMAAGLAILANTRPYEGAIFGGAVLVTWLLRKPDFRRQLLPLAAVLAVVACAMCYFFWRVTGNPFRMPYMEHDRQYATVPSFLFLPPGPAQTYHHPIMEAMWKLDARPYHLARTLPGFLRRVANEFVMVFRFYVGPALLLSLGALFWLRKHRRIRWLAGVLALMLLGILATAWNLPHYAAPATIVMLLLMVQGTRVLRLHSQWGAMLVRCILLACVLRAGVCLRLVGQQVAMRRDYWRCCVNEGNLDRARMAESLQEIPGKHLVIVEYSNYQPHFEEYVYNLADIDSQRIVWARSMGAVEDKPLLDYYKDRQIWLLSVGPESFTLRPYVGQ